MSDQKVYNKITVVDENDNIIGFEYMPDAIKKGLLRRAARVFVFNESGQLLVQRRSKHVLKPLLLDFSAAGHVDEGETDLEAAYRELFEELGIKGVELEIVEKSVLATGFFSTIYKTVVPDETEIKIDPEELDSVRWFHLDILEIEMKTSPEEFTGAFIEVWQQLRDKLTK